MQARVAHQCAARLPTDAAPMPQRCARVRGGKKKSRGGGSSKKMRRRPTPLRGVRHGPDDFPWLPAQPPPLPFPLSTPRSRGQGARAPRGAIPPPGPVAPRPARDVGRTRGADRRDRDGPLKNAAAANPAAGEDGVCVRGRTPTRTAINHIAHARAPRAWPGPTPTPHAPRPTAHPRCANRWQPTPLAPRPHTPCVRLVRLPMPRRRVCAIVTVPCTQMDGDPPRRRITREVPPTHAMGRIERPRQRACLTVISASVSSSLVLASRSARGRRAIPRRADRTADARAGRVRPCAARGRGRVGTDGSARHGAARAGGAAAARREPRAHRTPPLLTTTQHPPIRPPTPMPSAAVLAAAGANVFLWVRAVSERRRVQLGGARAAAGPSNPAGVAQIKVRPAAGRGARSQRARRGGERASARRGGR